MKYRSEIDGLRALAVVPVILFHAGFELFSGGFVGVDIFFVISGYLITTLLIEDIDNKRFSIVKFYERRARRILPALFFVVAVCIPFSVSILTPQSLEDFFQSIAAVTLFASNILFWRESGYFDTEAANKPLLHTWSLAVEEQYYILFPIFLLLAWRLGRSRVFWMIVVFAILSLALSEYGWRKGAIGNFYLAPTRAWELLAGSISAFIVQKRGVQTNNLLSILGLGAIVFSILVYDEKTPFPSVYALAPVLGTVLLVLFADKKTVAAKILSMKMFVGIGLISYSAYLWHQPIFAFARTYSFNNLESIDFITLIALVFVLAVLSWKYIEQPFRTPKVSRKTIFSASFVGAAIFLTLSSLYIFGVIPNKTVTFSWIAQGEKIPNKYGGVPLNGPECNLEGPLPVKICVSDETKNSPTLVFVGDSHARVLTEAAFYYYRQSRQFNFIDMSSSGCLFMPGLNIFTYGAKQDRCDAEYQSLRLAYLESLPPSIIVIHARFSMYLHGDGFNNGVGGIEPSRSYYAGITGNESYDERKQLIQSSLTEAVRYMLDAGHKVVIVGDAPGNGWDPIHRLAKIESVYGYTRSDAEKISKLMSIPRKNVEERQEGIRNIIDNIVQKYPQVTYIDALPIFCSETECNSISENMEILYADRDHLSFAGVQRLFLNMLDEIGLKTDK